MWDFSICYPRRIDRKSETINRLTSQKEIGASQGKITVQKNPKIECQAKRLEKNTEGEA